MVLFVSNVLSYFTWFYLKVPLRQSSSKAEENVDLPPGFGGSGIEFSKTPSCIVTSDPAALSTKAQCSEVTERSLAMGVNEEEGSIPPGFEAAAASLGSTEHHIKGEFFICPHGLSMGILSPGFLL